MSLPTWQASLPSHVKRFGRPVLIVSIYLVCWALLDWASLPFESAPEVQVWYPPSALDVVLLLVFGVRYAPALLLNTFIHQIVTGRPLPLAAVIASDIITTLGYAGACALLLHVFQINPRLRRLRDVGWLLGIGSFLVPLLIAIFQVLVFLSFNLAPQQQELLLILQYWAGDATGVAMLAPWLLIVLRRWPQLWAQPEPAVPPIEFRWPSGRRLALAVGEAAFLALSVWFAYGAPRGQKLDYTYFVFLPLVWYSVRYGLRGATNAVIIINVCAVLLVQGQVAENKVLALQFGLMVSSQIAVLLGAAIMEQRRAAAERRELDRALATAQRQESVARLARGVAHDFNNLLTVLRGNLDLALLDLAPGHPAHQPIEAAGDAAEHASDLTRQLLIYAGNEPAEMVSTDCNGLIARMESLLRSSVPRSIQLEFNLEPQLPLVACAPTQLRQIVINLVGNAADAIGQNSGTITVATSAVDYDSLVLSTSGDVLPAGKYFCLGVRDTGPGMDETTLARIFEPFFTTKPTGHGLGLPVVLGTIQAHHGGILIESVPGAGTTFRVLLPAQNA